MIIDGQIPGRFAFADDVCVAFGTHEPISPGHMLVVPREEIDQFTHLDPALFAHLSQVAQTIGRAQELAFPGRRAIQFILGFEVPHTHIHVVAATSEEDARPGRAKKDATSDELDAGVEAVRAALIELGFGSNVPTAIGSPELG